MHKLIVSIALLGLAVTVIGCNNTAPEPDATKEQAKHAADNTSPAAQSAEAAPSDPSIVYPGGKKKKH